MFDSRNKKKTTFAFIILLLNSVIIFGGVHLMNSTFFSGNYTDESINSKTIERNGVKYFPRQDITTFLVLGIDKFGPVESSEYYLNDGESDFVLLLVFDETNKKYDVICLNRDTMVEMPVIGVGGKKAGTTYGQLALAHTYGSGLEDSCENSKETVSALLNGIYIDYFVSVNMDAISIITDTVGGITVTVNEDFTSVDNSIKQGEVTLNGQQAISFVRLRKDIGDQLNTSRMERQKVFMQSLIKSAETKVDNKENLIKDTYEKIAPYMVTDCSINSAAHMFDKYSGYEQGDIIVPEGKNIKGEKHMEFYLDEALFDEMIIDIFYAEK